MTCHNCEKRKVGCHATCETYQNFRKKQDELLEEKHRSKDYYDYRAQKIHREAKRRDNSRK